LQQQLVGLIRAGQYVLTEVRDRERDKKNMQRARRPPPQRSSVSIGRAKELLPWLGHLSDHQRQVVTRLADGSTVTEVAKDIGKTHQAVQSALRRAEETVRAIPRT
jgi:DNA-directed RNA polymerase specialized sigma24 family protein